MPVKLKIPDKNVAEFFRAGTFVGDKTKKRPPFTGERYVINRWIYYLKALLKTKYWISLYAKPTPYGLVLE